MSIVELVSLTKQNILILDPHSNKSINNLLLIIRAPRTTFIVSLAPPIVNLFLFFKTEVYISDLVRSESRSMTKSIGH